MKALMWEAARTMTMRDEEKPTIPDDEILVRVGHVGICGSELNEIPGGSQPEPDCGYFH